MTDGISELKQPTVVETSGEPESCSGAVASEDATSFERPLLSECIERARTELDEKVTEFLSGFMRRHPRFDTLEGHEQWWLDIQAMYEIKQIWGPAHNRPVNAKSANELVLKYTKGKLSASEFWQGLDELVSNAALSSIEQRQLFWHALKTEDRTRVLKYCYLFDPTDALWDAPDSSGAKLAEQRLSRIMVFLRLDDWIIDLQPLANYMNPSKTDCVILGFMLAIIIILGTEDWKFALSFAAFFALFGLLIFVPFGFLIRRAKRSVRELAAKRQTLLLPEA